jgi:hypothetical protein
VLARARHRRPSSLPRDDNDNNHDHGMTTTRLAPLACSLGPGRDYGSGSRVGSCVVEACAVAEGCTLHGGPVAEGREVAEGYAVAEGRVVACDGRSRVYIS